MGKTLNSGIVIQIKLQHNLGFMYAKVINLCDFSEYDLSNTFHLLLYSYNYIVEKEEDYKEEDFLNSEPFAGPLFVSDILWAIRRKFYKVKGEVELRSYEKIVPAFRSFGAMVFKPFYFEDEATNWSYFEGGVPRKYISSTYENVKHLEGNMAHDHEEIETRFSMELLYRKNKDLKEFYGLEEQHDLTFYNNIVYKTPFNEVEDLLKGVVLPSK